MTELAVRAMAEQMGKEIALGQKTWLFLDYDGTLADFTPTPDTLLPDKELIELLQRLATFPGVLRIAVLSGRRFSHIQALLPVPGILLAGNYGIEFQTWEGERVRLVDFDQQRPFLDQVKKQWAEIITHQPGFFLEDKGFSLALHGRDAPDNNARDTLAEASKIASGVLERGTFRILGGNKFLEVAPTISDKGQSLSTLLKRFAWPGARILYFGDDDKDEEAFKVVLQHDGIPIVVSRTPKQTLARYRLESPANVRAWLQTLAETLRQFVS